MDARSKDLLMYGLGAVIILAAVGLVVLLIYRAIPDGNRDIINIALGALVSMAVTVVTYFYGSSKGSADKAESLRAARSRLEDKLR